MYIKKPLLNCKGFKVLHYEKVNKTFKKKRTKRKTIYLAYCSYRTFGLLLVSPGGLHSKTMFGKGIRKKINMQVFL